jgi:hypothetical protein
MTSTSSNIADAGLPMGNSKGLVHLTDGEFQMARKRFAGQANSNIPSPERPQPHPERISTVPFPHDPDFVSRDELLDQIYEKSSAPGSRIVLVGLGGVGSVHHGRMALQSRLTVL